jgi:hypothetical protein
MTTTRSFKKRTFTPGQSVFKCRICGRMTRDVEDNGNVDLCPDCYLGATYENGYEDASDPETAAYYEAKMREAYQRAVDKGGSIAGYTKS